MVTVKLTGWQPGLNNVQLTKTLKAKAKLELHQAKFATDELLEGKQVSISMDTLENAEDLLEAVRKLGAIAEIE
jgi:hypothetical protein